MELVVDVSWVLLGILLDVWLVMPVLLEVANVILLNAILLVSEPSRDRAFFF
jgi:hypothetical protein